MDLVMKTRVWLWLFPLLLLLAAGAWHLRQAEPASKPAPREINIRAETVRQSLAEPSIKLVSKLAANRSVAISPEVTGRIATIAVSSGQQVTQGQTLIALDAGKQQAELAEQSASVRDEARKLLEGGADPGEARKAQKAAGSLNAANSFEVIAREWHGKFLPTWTTSHADKIMRRFERDVFPWLGSRPVAEIDAPALLVVLRRIESRGATETAHRTMMQSAGQVFRAMPSLPGGRSATLRLIW